MTMRQIVILGIAAIILVFGLGASTSLFEKVDAGEIMVVQDPVDGQYHWYTTPGVKFQGFGKVTVYHKRSQFWFSHSKDQGAKDDQAIRVRFNDNGHASISGSIAWEMPLDQRALTLLHTKYGSQLAIEQQLIRTMVEKTLYMTGPLMSSKESSAERRNDLLRLIEDQVQYGVYLTKTIPEKQADPMTGQTRTVNVVKLVTDTTGKPVRAEVSPLQEFTIRTFNVSINNIEYDSLVEGQIQQQQKATMAVQIAIARAKEAEQEAITVAKRGEAEAAKAKWDQEVIKAKEVTAAEQRLRVAQLDAQSAEQTKRKETLLGEGEGARKRAVMQADGALEKKLAAWLEAQKYWSEAASNYKGNWVPGVVMGNNGGSSVAGSGAQQFMDLLTVKTAKDLGLDLQVTGVERTR